MVLKLDETQTQNLRTLLSDAKDQGEAICTSIHGDYAGVVGASWLGGASTAALGKQDEMLNFWKSQLAPILDTLVNGITGTTNLLTNQDLDSQNVINAIAPGSGGMNFGRLGGTASV
ncbi:hypothetical protein [Amycolatopsis thermoflava]|uniref:hypothetical protein n=1 Tax=Amycolatopsis thermoflava TaxID=84480 RepID=UPI00048421BB|nr:hypothetical protein [Amycolatopsis thermoflava]